MLQSTSLLLNMLPGCSFSPIEGASNFISVGHPSKIVILEGQEEIRHYHFFHTTTCSLRNLPMPWCASFLTLSLNIVFSISSFTPPYTFSSFAFLHRVVSSANLMTLCFSNLNLQPLGVSSAFVVFLHYVLCIVTG